MWQFWICRRGRGLLLYQQALVPNPSTQGADSICGCLLTTTVVGVAMVAMDRMGMPYLMIQQWSPTQIETIQQHWKKVWESALGCLDWRLSGPSSSSSGVCDKEQDWSVRDGFLESLLGLRLLDLGNPPLLLYHRPNQKQKTTTTSTMLRRRTTLYRYMSSLNTPRFLTPPVYHTVYLPHLITITIPSLYLNPWSCITNETNVYSNKVHAYITSIETIEISGKNNQRSAHDKGRGEREVE